MNQQDQIRERLQAATPGPWRASTRFDDEIYIETGLANATEQMCRFIGGSVYPQYVIKDATFIAHAPTDIAYLLDQLQTTQAEVAEYKRNGITLVDNVKGWGTYQHYKGGLYRVLATCQNEADGRTMVVYLDLESRKQWTRPEEEFFGEVSPGVKRFAIVPDAPLTSFTPSSSPQQEKGGEGHA